VNSYIKKKTHRSGMIVKLKALGFSVTTRLKALGCGKELSEDLKINSFGLITLLKYFLYS
jgi:hypothetical protein